MSFNIIAETSPSLDYYKIHQAVCKEELPFDFLPMPNLGEALSLWLLCYLKFERW
jgi:hypothetical protein